MKTKIFVMTHKKFEKPRDEIYIPLHVGRKAGKDLGYLGDDTGDSISELNPYYGELTGLYWLWKNYTDTDIIGICHYRRYFADKEGRLLTKEQYETLLEDVDVITSNPVWAESHKKAYEELHNIKDLQLTGEVIKELYPQDYPVFCEVLEGKKSYFGNLCVMRKVLFDSYCEWLFTIFAELEKRIDVSAYDDYNKRVFGFLSERLLLVYITAYHLRVVEGNIITIAEKAETVEFKAVMGKLVKEGQFTEARNLFYEYLKIRPDIALTMSDLSGELPDIARILYILEMEREHEMTGFYQISDDLSELIIHFRNVRDIVQKAVKGETLTEEDARYLLDKKVSDISIKIIEMNL